MSNDILTDKRLVQVMDEKGWPKHTHQGAYLAAEGDTYVYCCFHGRSVSDAISRCMIVEYLMEMLEEAVDRLEIFKRGTTSRSSQGWYIWENHLGGLADAPTRHEAILAAAFKVFCEGSSK